MILEEHNNNKSIIYYWKYLIKKGYFKSTLSKTILICIIHILFYYLCHLYLINTDIFLFNELLRRSNRSKDKKKIKKI